MRFTKKSRYNKSKRKYTKKMIGGAFSPIHNNDFANPNKNKRVVLQNMINKIEMFLATNYKNIEPQHIINAHNLVNRAGLAIYIDQPNYNESYNLLKHVQNILKPYNKRKRLNNENNENN